MQPPALCRGFFWVCGGATFEVTPRQVSHLLGSPHPSPIRSRDPVPPKPLVARTSGPWFGQMPKSRFRAAMKIRSGAGRLVARGTHERLAAGDSSSAQPVRARGVARAAG